MQTIIQTKYETVIAQYTIHVFQANEDGRKMWWVNCAHSDFMWLDKENKRHIFTHTHTHIYRNLNKNLLTRRKSAVNFGVYIVCSVLHMSHVEMSTVCVYICVRK